MDLVGVIMAGGAGTRFWPLSTAERPKQFLRLVDEESLLQKSFLRLEGLIDRERILVLTNEAFVPLVREQLPQVPAHNVVGEPLRRDTAAAVCLAAALVRKRFGDSVIATVTADHLIEPVDEFRRSLISAARGAVDSGALYTFGIRPTSPATAYGYLETGKPLDLDPDVQHFRVASFREKPDLQLARKYLASGNYFWNSGMFVWSTQAILRELEANLPLHVQQLAAAVENFGTDSWPQALAAGLDPLESISIDFAVMEKAREVRCVASSFSWTDLGGWLALLPFLDEDTDGNACRGRIRTLDARRNLIYCDDPSETVVVVGVEGLVAVRAGDRTLIVPRNRLEEIKSVVAKLQS